VCLQADVARGLLVKVSDVSDWMDFKMGETFKSAIGPLVQKWFEEGHTHDIGATTQKVPFLDPETNRQLFNISDAYED